MGSRVSVPALALALALAVVATPAICRAQIVEFVFPDQGDRYTGPGGQRMFGDTDGVAGERELPGLADCQVIRGVMQVSDAQLIPNDNCVASFEMRVAGRRVGSIEVLPGQGQQVVSFDLRGEAPGDEGDPEVSLILEERLAVGSCSCRWASPGGSAMATPTMTPWAGRCASSAGPTRAPRAR